MKTFLTFVMILVIGVWSVSAVDWKTLNQATIEWDAVTTLIDDTPFPAEHTIKYRVYLAAPDKTGVTVVSDTTDTSFTLTFSAEGKYVVGVSAVRLDENGAEVEESEINWSDVNGAATPNPFGFIHYIKPAMPTGLK